MMEKRLSKKKKMDIVSRPKWEKEKYRENPWSLSWKLIHKINFRLLGWEKTISITILKITVRFAVHLLLLALASERRRVASGTGSKQSFLVLLAKGIQLLMQRSLFRLVFNLVIVSESALPSLWISRVEEGSDSIAELLGELEEVYSTRCWFWRTQSKRCSQCFTASPAWVSTAPLWLMSKTSLIALKHEMGHHQEALSVRGKGQILEAAMFEGFSSMW